LKRINPDTGETFRKGDLRDDCFRFWAYRKNKDSKGYFVEIWRSWERYEKELKRTDEWQANNRGSMNAHASTMRAKRLKRKPKWIKDFFEEEIKVWYKRANLIKQFTGQLWEVDHIEPLNGKDVSGLHVPWNLQLLPKKQNRDKRNKRETQ
jgi:hypothetical protein